MNEMNVKCFDVASMVIEEATKQFGSTLRLDDGKLAELEKQCEVIDTIAGYFDGVSYEVTVDNETTDITIALVCGEITILNKSSSFDVVKCAKKLKFGAVDNEHFQVDFVFDGVWSV